MIRPTLRAQAAWARWQAAQHARLAALTTAGSPSRRLAEDRRAIAEAAAASLLDLASRTRRKPRQPKEPAPCPTPRTPLRFLPPDQHQ